MTNSDEKADNSNEDHVWMYVSDGFFVGYGVAYYSETDGDEDVTWDLARLRGKEDMERNSIQAINNRKDQA